MSVITISRGSYSKCKEVAEKTAERLGYDFISRDIILEASKEFNIPEIKLVRALHDAPSILNRFRNGRQKYIAFIRAALLKHFSQDNIVYHGLAGHFFVKGIPHALKVRIIADMEDRIKLEMDREGISRREARHVLKKDDEERRKWSQQLYGIDTWDASLYDLVIHIRKISVDDAVDIICHTVGLEDFQTTPASKAAMEDLSLSATVKAAFWDFGYELDVHAEKGVVYVKTEVPLAQESTLANDLENISKNIKGVKDIKVNVLPSLPYSE
ncbi:MAG: cytidylate kinase-like family protein [Candidatus Adiutricales bacterium]